VYLLASELKHQIENLEIIGLDNLSRPGSEQNRQRLNSKALFSGTAIFAIQAIWRICPK